MEFVIVGVFLGVLVVGALGAWWLTGPDEPTHGQDRRAGRSDDVSPDEAARRAIGRTSWTRGGGGGS
ncbi:hypothetical protein [Aeromicrobium sp. Leaf350]|uniref:hypothetical protein n=1 Tax=Aeromicrobium sp. Leaf350 TaxID=2876565 RepID=UPI001E41BCD6|nr:hypothetical protein [Aeromicrobium sp. Leaf350]